MKVMLMVLWDGRVMLDQGEDHLVRRSLMHDANFIVVENAAGRPEVWKERYEPDLVGRSITHKEMFEHAARHQSIALIQKAEHERTMMLERARSLRKEADVLERSASPQRRG